MLIKQSRPSGSVSKSTWVPGAGVRIATNQVPVESTVDSKSPISENPRAAIKAAFESCKPQYTCTSVGKPVLVAIAGRMGPSASLARRSGGSFLPQPRASARSEGRCSIGSHKSVWQPRLVISDAATSGQKPSPILWPEQDLCVVQRTRLNRLQMMELSTEVQSIWKGGGAGSGKPIALSIISTPFIRRDRALIVHRR